MNEYQDFTSLPPEAEREFVIYEKTSVEAGKKAKIVALAVAFGFLVVVMGIVFSFPPPENKMAHDDMGGLAAPKTPKKEAAKPAAEAPKPAGEGAAAGTEAKPAEGAAAGTEAKPAEGTPAAAEGGSKAEGQ